MCLKGGKIENKIAKSELGSPTKMNFAINYSACLDRLQIHYTALQIQIQNLIYNSIHKI